MHWLQSLDVALFHCVNPVLSNRFFDIIMPILSGNRFFGPLVFVVAVLLFWKGGARGRVFLVMVLIAVWGGDSLVCNTLKHAIQRPRPFWTLPDVHIPNGIGRTDSGSMPSSHAANWFAGTMVAFIYYRRSWRFMLPMALLVSFSRIYNGVHYPSDVLAGAVLGAGYAACIVWTADRLWRWAGQRWFPLWWARLPSLANPVVLPKQNSAQTDPKLADAHLIRLAYALIFATFAANLIYIGSGIITLSEDEAYQWIWSKHLALSYYSKPLLIALTQYAGTHLWGDTAFGVRFFSPVITLVSGLAMLRFMQRVGNPRAAFWLAILLPMVPLISLGSTLMTIDPLQVMFWLFAMIAGWDAVRENSTWRDWFMVGLWMGLGLLSKYTALFQLLCWVIFFALYPPSRKQLRRIGPYLALFVNIACSAPILIWNSQRNWITVHHVSSNGNFDKPWAFTIPNLWHGFIKYTTEFVGAETALQNPFLFLPVVWAAIVFWRRAKDRALMLYFFCMGAPVFIVYLLLTFHSRSLPNWIAPSIIPLFCLGVLYWEERWREGFRPIRGWLVAGLVYGVISNVVLRDTDLIFVPFTNLTGIHVRPDLDSTARVKGWTETAEIVAAARQKLLAEGKPVFIIGNHYGITGELTFHMPEARAAVTHQPLVYFIAEDKPENQFYFWPNYLDRKGENAIFVHEMTVTQTNTPAPPRLLVNEFESVTNLGYFTAFYHGRPMHRIQIIECRNLK